MSLCKSALFKSFYVLIFLRGQASSVVPETTNKVIKVVYFMIFPHKSPQIQLSPHLVWGRFYESVNCANFSFNSFRSFDFVVQSRVLASSTGMKCRC